MLPCCRRPCHCTPLRLSGPRLPANIVDDWPAYLSAPTGRTGEVQSTYRRDILVFLAMFSCQHTLRARATTRLGLFACAAIYRSFLTRSRCWAVLGATRQTLHRPATPVSTCARRDGQGLYERCEAISRRGTQGLSSSAFDYPLHRSELFHASSPAAHETVNQRSNRRLAHIRMSRFLTPSG